ncbi:MAG TPA: hypothetical protein VEQ42_04780, partial [Pyrinomonadaceae bacterium]|nr:hypothetical protein [Pyrinomonadaceae bacterium]
TNFPSFKVTLRNVSRKDIVYLEVKTLVESGRVMNVQWPRGQHNRPIIPAGEVYDVNVSGGSLGGNAPDGYTPNSPRFVEVSPAVFSDHSHEGDPASAARHLSGLEGQRAQLARVVALLREAAEGPGANEHAAAENLKAGAASLGREMDAAAREKTGARFRELGLTDPAALQALYEHGLDLVRKELLKDIEEFGGARAGGGKPFGAWLSEMTHKYKTWFTSV